LKNGVSSSDKIYGNASSGQIDKPDLLWSHLKSLPAFRALLRAVEARFYQHIDLPEPVLDLGCGDGLFAELTFDKPVTAGLDPWWGPLVKAKRTQAYGQVAQGLGHTLPFAAKTFGSAFSNSVLEHIADLQPVLYEINRVLRDNGRFVVTMPSHHFTADLRGAMALERLRLNSSAGAYRRFFNRIARHEHVDSPDRWSHRFADAGFTIESWQYYFSTKALHALEIGHLQGVPSALLYALTGHWILAPWESNLRLTEQWVRPFYEEEPPHPGTMMLFILRKSHQRPVSPNLPQAAPIILSSEGDDPLVTPPSSYLPTDSAAADSDALAGKVSAAAAVQRSEPDIAQPASTAPSRINPIESIRRAPRKRWLVLVSLLLALLASHQANNTLSANRSFVAIMLWAASITIAVFAFYDRDRRNSSRPLRFPRQSWEIPAVTILFVVALIFRLYDITSLPFILSGTEASIGLDALAVTQGNIQSPFATAWLTNPTMPLYLLSFPISILGNSILAVRILSPFIGAFTVVILYFLGRRLWGPLVGLLSAILLLGSHVHVHFSRLGMTNIWDPLFVMSAIGLLYAAWQGRSRKLWLAAGLVIGLNAYLYTASHILPLILLGLFLYLLLDWRELWGQRSHIFGAIILAAIVALPQLLFYRSNPMIFMDRANSQGIVQSGWYLLQSESTGLSQAAVLLRQLVAGMLSLLVGQDNSPAYMPGGTILGFWAALLLVAGIVLSLWRYKQFRYALLIIWLGVTLLFAAALLESPPQSHRLLIALPAVYLLVSLGLIWLVDHGLRLANISKRYLIPIVFTVALVILVSDMLFYFGEYRRENRYGDRNTEVAHELSLHLNSLDGPWLVYFYGAPSMYASFPTFAYLIDEFGTDISLVDVLEPGALPPAIPGTNTAFAFLPERLSDLQQVQNLYQQGELTIIRLHIFTS